MMKFYHSIRFRVVAGTLLFCTLLIIINGVITFFMAGQAIGRLMDNLLETELNYFLYQYEQDKSSPLPHSKYITAFKGIDQVPERIRPKIENLPPGVHTVEVRNNRPPAHVGVIELPDTKERYYLRFHARDFFRENEFMKPGEVLMISLGLLLVPGLIIGVIGSRVLFRPVSELMEKIRCLNPENIPGQWEGSHKAGEVGMLTRTIESAMSRIREFIRREKQFTRDASHELRTPLTIAKGAVEIMEGQPEVATNPKLEKPLNRIRGAIRDMETTIETFLWLAREEHQSGESARVADAVHKAVENSQYLIESKPVSVAVDIRHNTRLPVKEEILYITVVNLVRNAFQFTPEGAVTIRAEKNSLAVTDTGTGIAPEQMDTVTRSHIKGEESRGFGLGLSIVSRLCSRFGWELDIRSRPGEGTRVTINWGDESQA
ncbi:MAG: HAMP domain-containing histidine kinase [Desulfobacter sp.]|nr:MAG: HAMP domain-containing histidine kinase [Desulfobacter sp.]